MIVSGQELRLLYEYRRRQKQHSNYDPDDLAKARANLTHYFEMARGLKPLPHQVKVMEAVQEFLEFCWSTPKEQVKGRRVLNINLPPGAGKSSIITTTTPPWILGKRPFERIGVVSGKGELADLFELVAKRDIESGELYRAVFPDDAVRPNKARAWSKNKLFIKGLPEGEITPSLSAMSIMGAVMGKRFSCIIIDDGQDQESTRTPHRRDETWAFVDNTVLSRAPMWCPVINVQQRLHPSDISGRFEQYYDARTVKVSALDEDGNSYWEEEYPTATLEQKRRVNPYSFALWYQQDDEFDKGAAAIFNPDNFQYHKGIIPSGWRIQSWDTASKAEQHNDLSAYVDAVITPNLDVYVLDMGWMRLEAVELEKSIENQYSRMDIRGTMHDEGQRYPLPSPGLVLIEDASSGQTLLQRIRKLTQLPVQGVRPLKDKVTRAKSVQGWFKAGKVFFPADHPLLVQFEAFLTNFPQSSGSSSSIPDDDPNGDVNRHDDPVDALVQLLQAVINDEVEPQTREIRMSWV